MLFLAVIFVISVFAQQTFADEPEAIVGGTAAAPGEFPWQVSLQVYGQHVCGGSIIAPTKILTAAHCIKGVVSSPWTNFRIVSRTTNVNQGQSHAVQNVRIHPNYVDSVRQSWVNDVAVITLKKPIKYDAYQKNISLADNPPIPNTKCTLSGWGKTSANAPASRNLLKIDQFLISLEKCQQVYEDSKLSDSHLCAINKRGIGGCQGDSGGPLVCNGKQYGIVSWNVPCARGLPDAFTNVFHHRSFILSS